LLVACDPAPVAGRPATIQPIVPLVATTATVQTRRREAGGGMRGT